jgi:hypothetical protein
MGGERTQKVGEGGERKKEREREKSRDELCVHDVFTDTPQLWGAKVLSRKTYLGGGFSRESVCLNLV